MPHADLDIERPEELIAYMREAGRLEPGETPRIEILAGGVSNKTVFFEPEFGQTLVLKQALAKLRVKADWFSDPARVHREAEGLRALIELAPVGTITPLAFEDERVHLLAMYAVPKPHENWKELLLAGRLESGHVAAFAELLGTIQRRAHERREELAARFADRRFFESLRLEPYYAYAAEHVPEAAGFLHALIAAARARTLTLVHGDYSPKNVLIHKGRLVLLDHEVIHWGDPAFDIGFALTHFLSKAHHLPAQRTAFADAAILFWNSYLEALGEVPWRGDLEACAVRHTLGCLLARVAGRSPLEYLNPDARARQRAAVCALMTSPPPAIPALCGEFLAQL